MPICRPSFSGIWPATHFVYGLWKKRKQTARTNRALPFRTSSQPKKPWVYAPLTCSSSVEREPYPGPRFPSSPYRSREGSGTLSRGPVLVPRLLKQACDGRIGPHQVEEFIDNQNKRSPSTSVRAPVSFSLLCDSLRGNSTDLSYSRLLPSVYCILPYALSSIAVSYSLSPIN